MAEVYGNLVIVVIFVMEGVNRAALWITALTLDGMGLGDNKGNRSFYMNDLEGASPSILQCMPAD